MRRAWQLPLLLVAGTLAFQAAWILAVPPFRGLDEFDHAYRAAAVAGGEWRADQGPAPQGRGDLVTVPESLPPAAAPVCTWLRYTGHDNCFAAGSPHRGWVTVGSGAAQYNPLFYWAVGSLAAPADGTAFLYRLRIVSAILCAALVGLAAWCLQQWARTRWPVLLLLVAMTPVTTYTLSVAAPNGVELAAALALWAAGCGIAAPEVPPGARRRLLWWCIPSGLVLVSVRALGPLWLTAAVIVPLLLLGHRRTREVLGTAAAPVATAAALLGPATAASVWWTVSFVEVERAPSSGSPLTAALGQVPLWLLQAVAAFPARNEPAPLGVYAGMLALLAVLALLGWRTAPWRIRVTAGLLAAAAMAVPLAVTVVSYSAAGTIWQGRYGLPLWFGVLALLGMALDTTGPRGLPQRLAGGAGVAVVTGTQAWSVVHVVGRESAHSPLAHSAAWVPHDAGLVALLALVAGGLWLVAVRTAGEPVARRRTPHARSLVSPAGEGADQGALAPTSR